MADTPSGIEITVSGEADSGKSLICNVINKALTDVGFTNVSLLDSNNGEPIASLEPKTYLDLARQGRPELFDTPITIVEMDAGATEEEEAGTDTGFDDALVLEQNLRDIETLEAAAY